jgi:glycosyltransferase involved in cell wall biosynthesis
MISRRDSIMIEDKILLSTWGSTGGVDIVVNNLVKGLADRGISADYITHNPNDSSVQIHSENRTHFYKSFYDFLIGVHLDNYAIVNLHSCTFSEEDITMLRIAAEHLPIIYHVHGVTSHAMHVEIQERGAESDIRYIEWLRTQPIEQQDQRFRRDIKRDRSCQLQEVLFKEANTLIFLNDFTRSAFREWYPEHSQGDGRELIIPNGSDFHIYADSIKVQKRAEEIRSEIGKDSKIIMYSGRIVQEKGAPDLAAAFDKIKESYPEAKLLLVGTAYNGTSCIFDQIREQFRGDVIMPGWLTEKAELAAYLKAADVLVIPSYHENFSVAALEAMFLGVPVIMGDVDGSHEVYVEPQLAYGTKPGDIGRMVQLFNYLFEDKSRAMQNASHVQEVVNQKYMQDMVVDSTIGMYSSVLYQHYARLMEKYIAKKDYASARRLHSQIASNIILNPRTFMQS